MLEIERFEPPQGFRERALWSDPQIYDEAAADPEGWWLRQSRELLDWDSEPTQALDGSNPPFYKWFADGRLNASAQCLDRHVEAGNGDRGAFPWRGGGGGGGGGPPPPPPPRRPPPPPPPHRPRRPEGGGGGGYPPPLSPVAG